MITRSKRALQILRARAAYAQKGTVMHGDLGALFAPLRMTKYASGIEKAARSKGHQTASGYILE